MVLHQCHLQHLLRGPLIPQSKSSPYISHMSSGLTSFAFALLQALDIYTRVMARDGLFQRPEFVSRAIAGRLRAGVRVLEAYLRRVLVLIALELEHELVAVWRPENLARAKASLPRLKNYSLRIYPADKYAGSPNFQNQYSHGPSASIDASSPPIVVPIRHWLDRLEHLHTIAKDPTAKARRLAYNLARSRHGILMAPDEPPRKLHRWSREAAALYDAMAHQIMTKSRARPPPLPPPRRGPKPTITIIW